jgi:ferredoxin
MTDQIELWSDMNGQIKCVILCSEGWNCHTCIVFPMQLDVELSYLYCVFQCSLGWNCHTCIVFSLQLYVTVRLPKHMKFWCRAYRRAQM